MCASHLLAGMAFMHAPMNVAAIHPSGQTHSGSWAGAAVWCRMAVEFLALILPAAAPELAMERFKLAQVGRWVHNE